MLPFPPQIRGRGVPRHLRRPLVRALAAAGVLALGPAAHAQLPAGGGLREAGLPGPSKRPVDAAPAATQVAGNGVYRVHVSTGSGDARCGGWTATTGPLHEAGSGLNVLYGDGQPGTSDTIFRSWTSGRSYRTAGNTPGACRQICDEGSSTAEEIRTSGVLTGFRMTWRFTDGTGGPEVEVVQEVAVEGPVDGTQDVDDTVIRETHVVRNLGPGLLRFGLRKHWDWEISNDDGPWWATCDEPTRGCDRSMEFRADGSGAGLYPVNYVINQDPETSGCPGGLTPRRSGGCDGTPEYLVAGTVSLPSALDPPPDPPEALQFNAWTSLVADCWRPGLDDAALCGDHGSPTDDTAVAYFYGLTSATAIELQPGEERSFTQYVVAAEDECPEAISDPGPVEECAAGGPHAVACSGPTASVALDGTATGGAASWTTTCPGGVFADPSAADTVLTFDVDGCDVTCTVTLHVGGVSCTADVVVHDDAPPSIAAPADLVVACPDTGTPPREESWREEAAASDACGAATAHWALIGREEPCAGEVVATYAFWAEDACGNASQAVERTFSVVDDAPPSIDVPADLVVECPEAAGAEAAWLAALACSDGCSGCEVHVQVSAAPGCGGTSVRTLEAWATDACGTASAHRLATLSVVDTTPPVIADVPADAVAECGAVPPAPVLAVTDACAVAAGSVAATETRAPGACAGEEIVTRTWSAADACGNAAAATQVITVRDTAPPVLAGVPADAVAECGAVPAPAAVTASDACGPDPAAQLAETTGAGSCASEHVIARTWTAVDACGNAASATQRITVRDTAPPAIAGVPPDAVVACDAVPPPAAVTASDACDAAPVVGFAESSSPGRCAGETTLTRTWTATDACGNAAAATQVLTVRDVAPPVLSGVPGDATVACGELPAPAAVGAADACDPAPIVSFAETTAPGPCAGELVVTRTWTATDACGNAATASQVLVVRDQAAPVLSGAAADVVAECGAVPAPPVVTASDACDPDVEVVFAESPAPGGCAGEQVLTRTWTAVDACGNAASLTQVVTVRDTSAPRLEAPPADAVVACGAIPPAATLSATDACDPAPAVTLAETSSAGACAGEEVLTRTWTAVDACGNAAVAVQVLTVRDATAPVLAGVPADATIGCDEPLPAAAPTAADACDPSPGIAVVEERLDGPCEDRWTVRRTWTATDACGNATQGVQLVTVVDGAPPSLAGVPADAVVECDAPPPAAVSASDACDPAPDLELSEVRHDGRCPAAYRLERTWTATDRCGNAASAQQVVRVDDTEPPVLAAPADLAVPCPAPASGPGSEAAWLASASASDGCSSATVLTREVARFAGCGGSWSVTHELWAVDACGNESPRVTRTYAAIDVVPPDLVPPADLAVECPAPESGPGSEAEWLASAVATDACSGARVESRLLSETPGCGATLRRVHELRAVDDCGNASPWVEAAYEVVDTAPPDFAAPGADQFALSLWPPNHGYVAWTVSELASATDACGAASVRVTGCASSQPEDVHGGRADDGGNGDGHTAEDCVVSVDGTEFAVRAERLGACGPDGVRTYAIELTATDACGNAAVSRGTVSVEHDRSGKPPVRGGRKLGPNDPPPFDHVHATTYGTGCDGG